VLEELIGTANAGMLAARSRTMETGTESRIFELL